MLMVSWSPFNARAITVRCAQGHASATYKWYLPASGGNLAPFSARRLIGDRNGVLASLSCGYVCMCFAPWRSALPGQYRQWLMMIHSEAAEGAGMDTRRRRTIADPISPSCIAAIERSVRLLGCHGGLLWSSFYALPLGEEVIRRIDLLLSPCLSLRPSFFFNLKFKVIIEHLGTTSRRPWSSFLKRRRGRRRQRGLQKVILLNHIKQNPKNSMDHLSRSFQNGFVVEDRRHDVMFSSSVLSHKTNPCTRQ